jgi:hypothetical protein
MIRLFEVDFDDRAVIFRDGVEKRDGRLDAIGPVGRIDAVELVDQFAFAGRPSDATRLVADKRFQPGLDRHVAIA